MRLLVAANLYPPDVGGPATYARFLAEHLPPLGVEVEVIPFRRVMHLPTVIRHIVYVWLLFARARHADALFVQDTVSTGIPATAAARLAGKKLVVRVPGDFAWEQGWQRFGIKEELREFQSRNYGWRVTLLRILQKHTIRRASLVIVASRFMQDIVKGWGVCEERLRVIPNAVSRTGASSVAVPLPPRPIILTAGRLIPRKGFEELIALMRDLSRWRLVIAGDGPLLPTLKDLALDLGVADRVTFTGALSRESMNACYRGADVFVLNSYFESFSLQVAEAMAAGIPVIATRVGAIPELLQDNREGMLVERGNREQLRAAIESVLDEPDAWKNRSQLAGKKAQGFSAERVASTLVHELQKLTV